jgi:hypothetical protein
VDVGSLVVNSALGGGQLDVGTSLVNVAAGGMSAAQLVAALTAGRNGGSWAGAPGITSRSVAADVAGGLSRSVGWMSRGDGGLTFGYAAPGDTNLDGLIDVVDMATFMSAGKYESGLPATWAEGDFNYDGFVDLLDAADFMAGGLFDAGIYSGPSGGIAAVPEPAGLGVIGFLVAAPGLARAAMRRRDRRAAGSLGAAAGSTRARPA